MRNRRSRPRPLREGFTLIELVIVSTIIGVVLAIAVPAIVPSRSAPDEAAQVISSAFMLAQRTAVTEQANVIVSFDGERGQVRIHLDANQNREEDPGERVTAVALGDGVQLGTVAPVRRGDEAPITFTAHANGHPAVTFRRNGSASEAGAVYLTWRGDRADDSRLVTLTRATGRTDILRYREGRWQPVGGVR